MDETKREKRIAIVGTAPTWRDVPWGDPGLECWLLNDMHVLNPPRADRWFDLHPFHQMFFRTEGQKLYAHEIPAGTFVRPAGHIEWLKQQTIPVYVQEAALLGSPSAVTFPREAVIQRFGTAFASTPAWMVALAILDGATEIHIYGIHLATEWEYVKQKPNMLFLMGVAAGLGITIVLPKGCPLIATTHQYAYEDDPDIPKQRLQRRIQQLQHEKTIIAKQAKQRPDPNEKTRLAMLDAMIVDCQLGIQHVVAGRRPVGV